VHAPRSGLAWAAVARTGDPLVTVEDACPSPGPIPERASTDHHAGRVVAGHGGSGVASLQRRLPVLAAPSGGVGGVLGHHPKLLVVGHLHEPVAELRRGHSGDDAAQMFAATATPQRLSSDRSSIGETEILDRHRPYPARAGQRAHLADGGAQPSVPGGLRQSRQIQRDGHWWPDRVAVVVDGPAGQVVGVEVHRHHPSGDRVSHGRAGTGLDLPACMQIPTLPGVVPVMS